MLNADDIACPYDIWDVCAGPNNVNYIINKKVVGSLAMREREGPRAKAV